jgi:hypothetical protein
LCGRGVLVLNPIRKLCMSFQLTEKVKFTKEKPLRGYDDRKEDWPKCMHDKDCLVKMCTEGTDGGRRFFKCPRAWVIVTTIRLLHMFPFFCTTSASEVHLLTAESYIRFRKGREQR